MLTHFDNTRPDIILLSDIRLDKSQQLQMSNDINYYTHFNSNSSNSRGVAILIKKSAAIKTETLYIDNSNNIIIIKCNFEEKIFILVSIYGPNQDDPDFFTDLFDRLTTYNEENVIIGGDYNVTLNHQIDNLAYQQARSCNTRKKLNQLMNDNLFIDAHTAINGPTQGFTWIRRGGDQKARLDMFSITESMRPFLSDFKKLPRYKSDHHPIQINIDFSKFSRGKGVWKFNDNLTRDDEFNLRIEYSVKDTLAKYYVSPDHQNFYLEANPQELNNFHEQDTNTLSEKEFNIDPSLLMEMILNDIRNSTISYSVAQAKIRNNGEKEAYNNLSRAQNIVNINPTDENQAELDELQQEYTNMVEINEQIKLINNNKKHRMDGEKATKFFCNLEKNFSAQKYISSLKVQKDGQEKYLTEQKKNTRRN